MDHRSGNSVNYRSIAQLDETILRGLPRLPADIDLVIGVPRSGLLAANIVALHRNLPLTDVASFVAGRTISAGTRGDRRFGAPDPRAAKHALVLDDSILTGAAMNRVRESLASVISLGASSGGASAGTTKLTYAAVYVEPSMAGRVDFSFEELAAPRIFEWNVMHGGLLARACVDIDGVLCVDPIPEENDDGPRYLRFLRETAPLLRPTVQVGHLVTCRLEKYRAETESWLDRHSIQYGTLHMLDLPTKEARQRAGIHGRFKSEMYRRTGAELFVESSRRQADEIAHRTGRPVLCIDDRVMVLPSMVGAWRAAVQGGPSPLRRWLRGGKREVARRVRAWRASSGPNEARA